MDQTIYDQHYETIRLLVDQMGIDSTDDYLKEELKNITKNVTHIREKILTMKDIVQQETNSDSITHLQYTIEEATNLLNNLLQQLKTADERYLCFKKYMEHKVNL